jgi:molybdopterin-binding protein
MAYDLEYSNWQRAPLGCSSFCLSPTAPLTGYYYNDTSTMTQYTGVVAASKVILGVPYYGRKSCVTSATPNQYPTSAVEADTYLSASTESSSPANLVQPGSYASHRDANDAAGNERWDTWVNPSMSCTRELYWDDTVSLGNKYALVNSDSLRGVGIWNLNYGGGASELWSLLGTYFGAIRSTPLVSYGPQAIGTASGAQTVTLTNGSGASANVTSVNLGGANASDFTKGTDTCTGQAIAASGTCTVQYTFTPSDNGVRNATATFVNSGPNNPASALVGTGGASEASTRLFFSWYDFASTGVNAETIHITNPSGALATGTISLTGAQALSFNVYPGQDSYYTFPRGTIGGPVVINSTTVPVLASLRAWYYQSFNETPARTALDAATKLYFPWYDLQSAGVRADTIHVTNPGGAVATGTISLPSVTPINFTVAPGQDAYSQFPAGTIGGPVTITSDQPVLASLRAWYYQSFNETLARPATAATTTQYFPWYDLQSAGMRAETIHIANVSGVFATGTIALPGATPISFGVPDDQDAYFTFPPGTIGGPVTINSSRPVLASLRAWYYQSFNEVPGRGSSPASATQYFPWYDLASAGMRADTIHITNPGGATVTGSISKPFVGPITFSVGAGQDAYFAFPAQSIGGPVTISASAPVLAGLRAWYYQSFNEVPGSF